MSLAGSALDYIQQSFQAMGSRCEIKLYVPSTQDKHTAVESIIAEVRRFEKKYSRYLPDSIVSRINGGAGTGKSIKVDNETAKLLDYADMLFQQSDGLFDITSGVLRRIWNFKLQQLPTDQQITAVLPIIGWQKVHWQPPYIALPLPSMEIDLGGYVKEYTADAAAKIAREHDIRNGLINLGGDIKIIGPHPDGSPWIVGIQHPRIPNTAIATIELDRGAIATSGDYERFMIVNGTRYSHLLNPLTGRSLSTPYAGISVCADQCIVAGTFSTLAMLKSEKEEHWVEGIGLPYLAIDNALELSGSIGFSVNY